MLFSVAADKFDKYKNIKISQWIATTVVSRDICRAIVRSPDKVGECEIKLSNCQLVNKIISIANIPVPILNLFDVWVH